MKRILFLVTALLSALMLLAELAEAGSCKAPADDAIPPVKWKKLTSGFDNPVHVTHAGDGSGDLYVVEQRGRIRIVRKRTIVEPAFLDISKRVDSGGEKGLLSVAFHPQYKKNGRLFVNYTAWESGKGLVTRIAEFRRDMADRANAASERILLSIAQPYSNHNGGQITFGPDGYLYIGMGDGGDANDPENNAQNTRTLLGAMLRIDVNRQSAGREYGIPADNPFADGAKGAPEIYAWGLRNPWRFSFDRDTGLLYAADVGQDKVEEVDIIKNGKNYGWRIMEGDICTPEFGWRCDKKGLTKPIHTYTHPTGFSITGGYVYRGTAIPGLCGTYLFADYVTKRLWGLRYDGKKMQATTELYGERLFAISSFGEDEAGEVYAVDHEKGRLYLLAKVK